MTSRSVPAVITGPAPAPRPESAIFGGAAALPAAEAGTPAGTAAEALAGTPAGTLAGTAAEALAGTPAGTLAGTAAEALVLACDAAGASVRAGAVPSALTGAVTSS